MNAKTKVPLKALLPLLMGFVNTALVVWDQHNERVIMHQGMNWDTGAPLWPYQTPNIMLFALNLPAYGVSMFGIHYFPFTGVDAMHYSAFFVAALVWWWLAGRYLDRRSLRECVQRTPIRALSLGLLAVGLIALGAEEARWAIRWWWTYSRTVLSVTDLILLRLFVPTIWCFALSFVALTAAGRRRHSVNVSGDRRACPRG